VGEHCAEGLRQVICKIYGKFDVTAAGIETPVAMIDENLMRAELSASDRAALPTRSQEGSVRYKCGRQNSRTREKISVQATPFSFRNGP
jgi:hypothetical protein